ncbi:MAG: hypothetical protein ABWZ02_12530 [Nakamurella sp.]
MTAKVTAKPLIAVSILGGPHDGERLATRLTGLTEGFVFRYVDDEYTFIREPGSGRWGAICSQLDKDALRSIG